MHLTIFTIWLIIAILAAIIEILSPSFGFFFVSGAALIAGVTAKAGLPLPLQIVLFVVTLLASLLFLRPRFLALLQSRGVPTRTESLLGKTGIVTEAIDPVQGTGRVTVAGEDWAARSSAAVKAGENVRVDGADGIVLNVSPQNERFS